MKIYIKNTTYGIFQIQHFISSTKKYIFSLLVPWLHYKQFTYLDEKKKTVQGLVLILLCFGGPLFGGGPRHVPTLPIG